VTVGIIACVEVTTTSTTGTVPQTTGTSVSTSSIPSVVGIQTVSTPSSPISGTTVSPTSVQTTTVFDKQMAQVGSVYVSSVSYSIQPLPNTNNVDLTNPTSNGVSFPSVPDRTGVLDQNNQPLYTITMTFNPAGVNSLSSIIVNPQSNVKEFSVEFFIPSNPNQPYTYSTATGDIPLSLNADIINGQPSIVYFPKQVPSPLSGIQINILKTEDNE